MKRRVKSTFSILFLTMLLLSLFLSTTEEGAISDYDGRTLAAKPVFGNIEYTTSMETWLKDRLGMRDIFINAYAVFNDSLFGEITNIPYQYGKEGYTFFKIHNNIEYNDYHRNFVKMVADMQEYCESRGSKFYYVFNPEKEALYRDYLPAGVNYSDRWADQMMHEMDRLGVHYIDLRESLSELIKDEEIYSRLYDAGHWSQTGAFYGMRTLTERIHKDIPEVKTLDQKEYNISSETIEKIYGSNQKFYEEIPVYSLKASYSDATGDMATELVRNNTYSYFQLIKNDSAEASGINRLLLFEDDLYGPFAVSRSKETAVISCLQNTVNFDYYYNIFKPNVVIFENMEYVVSDMYFSQASMEATVRNPAILKNFPEDDFNERKAALLESMAQFKYKDKVYVTPGFSIDKINVSGLPDTAQYAYIITDDKVIDLKADESGNYTADVRRGDISDDKEVVLYIIKDNKQRAYSYAAASYSRAVPKHTEEE